jgi:hypothetical protein
MLRAAREIPPGGAEIRLILLIKIKPLILPLAPD